MKAISSHVTSLAGLLALLSIPALAQDTAPPKPDGDTIKEAPSVPAPEARRAAPAAREPRSPERKPVPFIGVLTREISPEARAQLGLPPGFGLAVEEVMPDSPAKAAGIKEHDILVSFDDQRLANTEQLQALVRSKRKDDAVTLTVVSGGKESRVPVTIGEHLMEPPGPMQPRFFGMRPRDDRDRDDRNQGPRGMHPPFQEQVERFQHQLRDHQERFQQQMREYQERIQNWAREGSRGAMPQPPLFRGPDRRPDATERPREDNRPREGADRPTRATPPAPHRGTSHTASVTRSDETGVYSLREDNGRTVFSARPKDGPERSWTLNNEEDRRAIPEELRSKLRELDQLRAEVNRDDRRGAPRTDDGDRPPQPRGPGPDANPPRERESGPPADRPRDDAAPRDRDAPPPRRDGGSA